MVMFVQTHVFVNEGDSSRVCVNITGQLERSVAINVSIAGGSATGSDHYFPASSSLTFSFSPDTQCMYFKTTQDGIYESDETFSIRLDSSDPQVNTGVDAVYRIRDNYEGMYLINFDISNLLLAILHPLIHSTCTWLLVKCVHVIFTKLVHSDNYVVPVHFAHMP